MKRDEIIRGLEAILGDDALPFEDDEEAAKLRADAVVEAPATVRGWFSRARSRPYAPFCTRGLLVAFDGECEFSAPDRHASVTRYLLRRAGIAAPHAEDRRPTGGGLVLLARAKEVVVEMAQPDAHPSDYAFSGLIVAVADAVLERSSAPHRLLALDSDDQGVLIALMPAAKRDRVAALLGEHVRVERGLTTLS